MRNRDVKALARSFCLICVQRVTPHSENPLADDAWLPEVRELFLREPELQLIAEAILGQIRIPERHYEAPPERPVAKPAIEHQPSPVAAPVVVAAPAPMKPTQAEKPTHSPPTDRELLAANVERLAEHFMRLSQCEFRLEAGLPECPHAVHCTYERPCVLSFGTSSLESCRRWPNSRRCIRPSAMA